jgi:hypothetical protein
MCQCRITATGEPVTCPECATRIMQALIGDQQEEMPTTLTQGEYADLSPLFDGIDGYFRRNESQEASA